MTPDSHLHQLRRAVCKRCGGDSFREYGEVEIIREVTRKVEEVTLHADGSISAKSARHLDGDDLDFFHLDAEDHARFHGFECETCGCEERNIDELTIAEPLWGEKVNLPDGRSLYVEQTRTFDPGGMAKPHLQVYVAGEWWDFADVEPWKPHPGQLELLAA